MHHGRAHMQPHGYQNRYGVVQSGYGGYAGMMGARSGPVTLARVLPGSAYSGVGAQYEGTAPVHGVYGDTQATSVQWAKGAAPAGSSIPTQGGGKGNGISGQQWAQWAQYGLNILFEAGVPRPTTPQGMPQIGGPSLPGNPGNSGPTVGYTPPAPVKPPKPKAGIPLWGYALAGAGLLLVGAGGGYLSQRRSRRTRS